MTIVCGTDFSEDSVRAVDAACALARKASEEVLLVHAVDLPLADPTVAESLFGEGRSRARTQLEKESARLASSGVQVAIDLAFGASDSVLVEIAEKRKARLIVVGALGWRGGSLWRLGSTADRVAQTSSLPVLAVRDPSPITAWSKGSRTLRILLAVDETPSSDAAVRWSAWLEGAGSCRVVCAHVYWPPEQRERMQVKGSLPIGEGHPEVERALEAGLRARIEALRGGRPFELRILGGLGRTADHIVQIARDEKADLVVVGARQRTGLGRIWHGSVSHGVVDLAPVSVAVVPAE